MPTEREIEIAARAMQRSKAWPAVFNAGSARELATAALEAVEKQDTEIERLTAEVEKLRGALASCESWVDRWTNHVGGCEGGDACTCGRTAILYEARVALDEAGDCAGK